MTTFTTEDRLNAAPPHIVDSGASVMDKPVAWIDPKELNMAVSTSVTKHKQFDTDIPLYTHPAKESKAKDRFPSYESICLQCGTTIYKPSLKTLTDEQIDAVGDEVSNLIDTYAGRREFARAILRKAQEK